MLSYDKLLEEARKQIPTEALTKERFELMKLKTMIVGNRTEVSNFAEAADNVRRESEHILKYMSKELASAGEISGRKALFNGKFGSIMLNEKFEKYAKEYVLCKECGKPDSKLIKEDRQTFLKCEACGARRSVLRLK